SHRLRSFRASPPELVAHVLSLMGRTQLRDQSVLANAYWGRSPQMLDFKLGEVLACQRIDEMPIAPTPSFNCQCEQCGARIWVAYSSPIEPLRLCLSCSAAQADRVKPH